jgi:hypothetical protein
MPDPKTGLARIWEILKGDGAFFLSVDVGGLPPPDEPSPFTKGSLAALLGDQFEVLSQTDGHQAHGNDRDCSVRILAQRKIEPVSH